MGRDDGVGEYYGARGHDGTFAYVGVVEHYGAHADEGVVVYPAAVERGVVTDGYVVAEFYDGFPVEGVEYGAVLYVYGVAEADGVDVAAEYGSVPDAAVASHLHVADEGCRFGQKAVLAHAGRDAVKRTNNCHDE